jgi:leader peptidase (prepilin peptidase)/N-methyltransferase
LTFVSFAALIDLVMVFLLLLFILGLAVGSFLNLVIDRTPLEQSIVKPGSYCDHCRHRLSPLDLLPVASFLFLRGKCRYCRRPISARLPLLELFSGLIFVAIGLTRANVPLPLPLSLFAAAILIGSGVSDLINGLIPDVLVIPGLAVFAVWSLFFRSPSQLLFAVLMFSLFSLIYLATRGRGLGFGDVKLALLVGLILRPVLGILALQVALISGGVLALGLLATKRKKLGETIPLGPFLASAALIILLFGEAIINVI